MNKFLNKREINKRIVAVAAPGCFKVKHDIPDERIVCVVPTLEIAGCIVSALRTRQEIKLAEQLLAKHLQKGKGK
jgi:hypothetical protein